MPYISNTDRDRADMLEAIGVSSVDGLYRLPDKIKLKEPLDFPLGLSELDVRRNVSSLGRQNKPLDEFNSFLGAGIYDHYIPSALPFILSQSQFLTAYTPYQAECSQGVLQAIYEYQSYMCLLTGMEICNASLLDGASSLAEAVLMSLRISKRRQILVAGSLHPEYLKTLQTYLSGFDFSLFSIDWDGGGRLNKEVLEKRVSADTACLVIQSPNFFGLIEDIESLAATAKSKGALTIVVTNPLALAILRAPGFQGADLVCGDGQPLGGSTNFGGPTFGFLTAKKAYLRQMPGRIAGKTKDRHGKTAYCLTLQAREQHIRREKATSNICSNQSLNAIGAAVYLALNGSGGFKNIALSCFSYTQYLYRALKKVPQVKLSFGPAVFNEFVWEIKDARGLVDKLYKKGIIAGLYLGNRFPQFENGILSCCTEKKTKKDIDSFMQALKETIS